MLTKNKPGDIILSYDMKTFLLGRHGEEAARVQGKATIRDVARRAGVSIATVSRYLNRSGPVEEATGLRIARAVEETRYAPSMAAASLKTQRARMVLLVVPDVCNPFYSAMAREVQRLTGARGYAMALFNTGERAQEEEEAVRLARQMYAGGILFASVDAQERVMRALQSSGIPVVGLNAYARAPFDVVHVSEPGGTYLAARHLIFLGHRRIAFAGGVPGSAIGRNRLEGYERALREAGLRPLQEDVLETGFGQEDGYRAGCFFAALRRPPTAICCANDLIALGVVQALRERGLRVPQDVSVTGMDDIPYAALSSPRLTTVTNDSGVFAREGVRMLFERIDGRYDGPAREASVAHALVVRDSTAPPADE